MGSPSLSKLLKMPSSAMSAALVLLSSTLLVSSVVATVPFNNTFKFVNAGDFGIFINEYDASYRAILIGTSPFQVCFYNTTPSAYTLALRMATSRSESLRVWVWEANRGKPVGENAVFALLKNGNLVLAEADGRIVWQTNTANKGVVGFELLPNGNMVLYDAKRRFLWQSFDSPTDTLLVDQYLKLGGTTKLVSRASTELNANGAYSLEMASTRLAMYYTSPVDSQRYQYFSSSQWFNLQKGPLRQVTLVTSPKEDNATLFEISLNYQVNNSTSGSIILSRARYNPKYSYMRLGIDGNLKIYIYDDNADSGDAWQTAFTLFSRDSIWATECELPSRCGNYGLCIEDQCVACPTGKLGSPTGPLLGWNKNCTTQTIKSCSSNDFYYYQLIGVDHFSLQYTSGDGPMSQTACFAKCTNNCKCKGFFYHTDTQRCWAVNDLKTLISVDNNNHLAFIKAPK